MQLKYKIIKKGRYMCIISKYVFCLFGTKLFTKYNFMYIYYRVYNNAKYMFCSLFFISRRQSFPHVPPQRNAPGKVQVKQEKLIVKWHCDMIHLCLSFR